MILKKSFFSKPVLHITFTFLLLFSCHFASAQFLIVDYPFSSIMTYRLGVNSNSYLGSTLATLNPTGLFTDCLSNEILDELHPVTITTSDIFSF